MRRRYRSFAAELLIESIGLLSRPIMHRYGESLVCHVPCEVRAHDGQSGHPKLAQLCHRRLLTFFTPRCIAGPTSLSGGTVGDARCSAVLPSITPCYSGRCYGSCPYRFRRAVAAPAPRMLTNSGYCTVNIYCLQATRCSAVRQREKNMN